MVFDFLKKKKKQDLELPMPPKPPKIEMPINDIPEITFPEIPEKIPDFTIPEVAKEDIPLASDFIQEKPKIPKTFEPKRKEIIKPRIKPTFIAVDEYSILMESSNKIRAKLLEAEDYVDRLNQIKNQEKSTFEKWRSKLEDAERKLSYVDKVIAKAQEGN